MLCAVGCTYMVCGTPPYGVGRRETGFDLVVLLRRRARRAPAVAAKVP
jgi:hypothetical protein